MEYSEEFKAAMVRKLLPPNARSASELARELNLSQPTLSRWLREARSVGSVTTKRSKQWTTTEKLRVLLEADQVVVQSVPPQQSLPQPPPVSQPVQPAEQQAR